MDDRKSIEKRVDLLGKRIDTQQEMEEMKIEKFLHEDEETISVTETKFQRIRRHIQENYWTYVLLIFLIILLIYWRLALNYLLISILEPQIRDPEWNPLVEEIRAEHPNLFFTYGTAKKGIQKITWLIIFVFYFLHLILMNSKPYSKYAPYLY